MRSLSSSSIGTNFYACVQVGMDITLSNFKRLGFVKGGTLDSFANINLLFALHMYTDDLLIELSQYEVGCHIIGTVPLLVL